MLACRDFRDKRKKDLKCALQKVSKLIRKFFIVCFLINFIANKQRLAFRKKSNRLLLGKFTKDKYLFFYLS